MSLFDRIRALFTRTSRNGGTLDTADLEMISCHDALRLVHEYLDGELGDVPHSQVKAHFDVCERCYPHLHLETVFREALRRAARGQSAPPELKARLVQLLAEADAEG
jgi:anti-sigma factor (TIGR02949 family)